MSRQPGGKAALSTEDTSRKTSIKSVTVMGFIIIALSIYGARPYITEYISKINPNTSSHEIKTVRIPQKQKIKAALRIVPKDQKPQIIENKNSEDFVRFNQLAIQYIHNHQPWKGLYYFQKANAAAPKRIEPLVNVAVVYAELGYYPKAVKLFEKAYSLNPDFPPLLKNLKILYQAKLLTGSMLFRKFRKIHVHNKSKSKL